MVNVQDIIIATDKTTIQGFISAAINICQSHHNFNKRTSVQEVSFTGYTNAKKGINTGGHLY